MDKYLKMADVFEGEVKAKHIDEEAIAEIVDGEDSGRDWSIEDSRYWLAMSYEHAGYAAHAINSHDKLVADVERLTQSLNHANSNHELFERQYYLEKDKCEDLKAEVERLRGALHDAATSLETIHIRSFGEESLLDSKPQMRSFAGARAKVAREALAE